MPRTTRAAARAQEQQQPTATDEAQAQLQTNDIQNTDTLDSDTEDMREPLNPVAGNTKRGRGRPKKVAEPEEVLDAPQPNAEERTVEEEEDATTKLAPKRTRSTRGRKKAADPEPEIQHEEAQEEEFEAWGGGDTEPESVEEESVAVPTPAPTGAGATRRTKATEQKPELEQDAEVEPQAGKQQSSTAAEIAPKRSRSTRKAKKDSAETETTPEAGHDHASENRDNLQGLNTELEAKSDAPKRSKSTRGKKKADSETETLGQPVSAEDTTQDKIEEDEESKKIAKTPAKRPRAASKKSTAPKEVDTRLNESVEAQGGQVPETEESAEAEAQVQLEPEVSKSAEIVEPVAETDLPSEPEVPPKTPSRARSTRKQAAKVEEEAVPRTTRKTRRQQAEAEQEEHKMLLEEAQVHQPVQETKPVSEDVEQKPEEPAPMKVRDEQVGQPTDDAHPVPGTNEKFDEKVEVPIQSPVEQQTDQQVEAQIQCEDAVELQAQSQDEQVTSSVEEDSAKASEIGVQEDVAVPENDVVESIESDQKPHDEPSPEHDDSSSDSDLDDVERQIFDDMQRSPVRAVQQAPPQPDSFSDTPLGLTQSIDALDAMEEDFAQVEKNLHDVEDAKQDQAPAIVPDPVKKSTTTKPRPISMPPPPKPAVGSRPSSVASKPAARKSNAPSAKPNAGPAAKYTLQRSSSVRTAQTKESSGPTKPRQPGQAVDYLAMKRRPVSVSFPTPPPPVKSSKAPTRPTFALPGEAVAARLKAEKEERLRREAEKGQNGGAKKNLSGKELEEKKKREFKARPVPSFIRSTSGSEGARKDQSAEESEEKKKPTFKARPVPSFIKNPSAAGMVRQTASSKARQSLMQGRTESEEQETSSRQSSTSSTSNPLKRTNSIMDRPSNGQRPSIAPAAGAKRVAAMPVRPKQEGERPRPISVAKRASSSASISSSVSSTTARALNSATNHAASLSPAPAKRETQNRPLANGAAKSSGPSRATSSASNSTSSGPNPPRASSFTFSRPGPPKTSAPARPGPVVKSDVTAADKAAMKNKAKEIFNRDKLDRARQEQERKEKEEAARKARAEAAERGRQASRAWAEKMLKKKAPGQGEQAKA
ncbi:hypothetical protein IWX90DRAFT_425523 [Phyllosticta citrichinensis]|uniref:Carboxylesterase family protein n=1 Tax=Phyllosticta citrichinensis TaxID=1130410 RepID=A0ABR1Y428_9PEZI